MIWKTLSIYENNATKENKKNKKDLLDKSSNVKLGELVACYKCITEVPKASQKEWTEFLHSKIKGIYSKEEDTIKVQIEAIEKTNMTRLLKAFTDSDVISLILSKLLKQ